MESKLQEIFDRIQAIIKNLEKEKMDGFTDPRIVLCMGLQSLASNISVWMSVNKGKKSKDLSACCIWHLPHM